MKRIVITILIPLFSCFAIYTQSATDIVKKSDAKMKGEKTSESEMTLKIIRPAWDRTISFKNWTKGTEYSLALVTAPAKEKGQAFLKFKREMWSWNPTINRMIKLPPTMLAQGWMGSDYTNDDLINESSVVVDYTHSLLGEETVSGENCYKIELIPLEDAPVVWGKIIMWVSKNEFLQMKNEYYDEDGYLVKSEIAYDIKNMDGRVIPTRFELIPADKEGYKTVVILEKVMFNKPLEDSFFTQQNMKNVH